MQNRNLSRRFDVILSGVPEVNIIFAWDSPKTMLILFISNLGFSGRKNKKSVESSLPIVFLAYLPIKC